jgi:hypothetical protein
VSLPGGTKNGYNWRMPTPILTTKLYIPLPRPNAVLRPRLIERRNPVSCRCIYEQFLVRTESIAETPDRGIGHLDELGVGQLGKRVEGLLDHAALDRKCHRLRAARDAQLGEDAADVRLDRRGADHQLFGDLGIAEPFDQ